MQGLLHVPSHLCVCVHMYETGACDAPVKYMCAESVFLKFSGCLGIPARSPLLLFLSGRPLTFPVIYEGLGKPIPPSRSWEAKIRGVHTPFQKAAIFDTRRSGVGVGGGLHPTSFLTCCLAERTRVPVPTGSSFHRVKTFCCGECSDTNCPPYYLTQMGATHWRVPTLQM